MSLDADVREPSDAELLVAVQAGDERAYGVLWTRHEAAARRLAGQITRPSNVDDLVSEAFLRVLRAVKAGGGPDSAFRPYLFSTMRRYAIDAGRAYDQRITLTDDADELDVDHVASAGDVYSAGVEGRVALQAWESLPADSRTLLWHLVVEGETPAAIAPLLGVSPNGVSSRAVRAKERLRQAFLAQHLAQADNDECRRARANLGGYVRNALADRDRAAVRAHLDTCRRCTAALAELDDVNGTLRAVIAPLLLGGAVVAARYLAAGPHAAATATAAAASVSGGSVTGGSATGSSMTGSATTGSAGFAAKSGAARLAARVRHAGTVAKAAAAATTLACAATVTGYAITRSSEHHTLATGRSSASVIAGARPAPVPAAPTTVPRSVTPRTTPPPHRTAPLIRPTSAPIGPPANPTTVVVPAAPDPTTSGRAAPDPTIPDPPGAPTPLRKPTPTPTATTHSPPERTSPTPTPTTPTPTTPTPTTPTPPVTRTTSVEIQLPAGQLLGHVAVSVPPGWVLTAATAGGLGLVLGERGSRSGAWEVVGSRLVVTATGPDDAPAVMTVVIQTLAGRVEHTYPLN